MAKESIHTIERTEVYKRLPMNCAFDVLRNQGISTDLAFLHGRGIFNDSTTKVDYQKFDKLLEDVSVEIWLKPYGYGTGCGGCSKIISNGKFAIGLWGMGGGYKFWATSDEITYVDSGNDSVPTTFLNTDIHLVYTRNAAGNKSNFYINGALSGITDQDSGTPVEGGNIIVGNDDAQNFTVNGEIELINFYRKVLTAEECKNLSEKKRFRELNSPNTILEISANSGTISDRWGNALTLTDMAVRKDGHVRAMLFNGLTSVLETTLANDINSISFWIKPFTDDESIIDLGGGNTIATIADTLTAAWADNIYINGKTGTIVKNSIWNLVTCTVATAISVTDIDIGKIGATYCKGLLNEIRIDEAVLNSVKTSQLWTSTKSRYGL